MNYKCISKKDKFKNLTINREYDGIEEGDNIIVTADNGTQQKYNKKYFVVGPRTIDDVLTISYISNDNRDDSEYILLDCYEEVRRINLTQSPSSCALYELSGINQLISLIDDISNELNMPRITVSEEIWKRILECIRENNEHVIYLLCSTSRSLIDDAYWTFPDYPINTVQGINNNSGNTISIWIIRVHE